MAIEHVTRVRFAARRTTHQQTHLAISDGLLAQVVVDDQRMAAVEHEVFGHRRPGVGSDVLQRCGCRAPATITVVYSIAPCRSSTSTTPATDGVLLADRDVKALNVCAFLVQDRVDSDRRLARLSVANDQFALTTSDRRHRIDRFDAGLHRFADRLSFGNAGGDDFDWASDVGLHGAFAVERIAERIEHAADHGIAGGNRQQCAERFDFVTFFDASGSHQE